MPCYICSTCGVQEAETKAPPESCPICLDERQYVPPGGQRWTQLEEMAGHFHNRTEELEPGLHRIWTEPEFGIGQHALLVQGRDGNFLWDCTSLIDEPTVTAISRLGGVAAMGVSHPHFYGSCLDWSRALGGVPIYLSARDRRHMLRPGPEVVFFEEDELEPLPGLRMVRLGGHFEGSSILLWTAGAGGRGALLSGDTLGVAADHAWATLQYSFPNRIPLPASELSRIAGRISDLSFDRLYAAWSGGVIAEDARGAVLRSIARYLEVLSGSWPRG